LFGGLAVHCDGRVLTGFRTRKTGALLAYLAYHSKACHTREFLIDLLWPDSDLGAGRQSLSTSLSSLRNRLEPLWVEAGSVLSADRTTVRLNPNVIETDIQEFDSAVARAAACPEGDCRLGDLTREVDLYWGPLLPEFDEAWVLLERERLHEEYCAALAQLAGCHERAGRLDQAVSVARKAVSAEPLFEQHHRLLSRLLRTAGDSEGATRAENGWERSWAGDSGDEPGRTDAVATLTRKPARAQAPSPQPLLRVLGGRLPTYTSRFFGRERELDRLALAVQDRSVPMVTLAGPGGIGKTRLAVELAKAVEEEVRCHFVPLADLRDVALVRYAVAASLGLPLAAAESERRISVFLSESSGLLILDSFEHLAEGASWVQRVVDRSQGLVVLITSRHRLGAPAETEAPIGSIGLPRSESDLESVASSPSVALFVDRAQRTRPDFQITSRNVQAVVSLCTGLEGIPLAIELAAARSQVLTPAQMRDQLEDRFSFLVNKKRPMTQRQRTMAAALQWSYDLLSPELRLFYSRLGVFSGGSTGRAAAEILEEPGTLDGLEELIAASLVTTSVSDAEVRFGMLQTVRAFAIKQLQPEDAARLRRRHADYFLEFMEQAAPHLRGPQQTEWLPRMAAEQDNLREALRFADESDPELGLRLAVAATSYWEVCANTSERRRWLEQFLESPHAYASDLRARGLYAAGNLCGFAGEFALARRFLAECLGIARRLDDPGRLASALEALGLTLANLREAEAARACFDEGIALARRLGDRSLFVRMSLGLGVELQYEARVDEAWKVLQEGLKIAREIEDAFLTEQILAAATSTAVMRGDLDLAEQMGLESQRAAGQLGDKFTVGLIHWDLSLIAWKRGDLEKALEFWREHWLILRPSGSLWGMPHLLESRSAFELTMANAKRAVALFAAADALRQRTGAPYADGTELLYDGLREKIGDLRREPGMEAAWRFGARLSWGEAAEYAMSGEDTHSSAGKPSR
jgi:predicted ATPase/DNA-binding SARP family transcriptional activator